MTAPRRRPLRRQAPCRKKKRVTRRHVTIAGALTTTAMMLGGAVTVGQQACDIVRRLESVEAVVGEQTADTRIKMPAASTPARKEQQR